MHTGVRNYTLHTIIDAKLKKSHAGGEKHILPKCSILPLFLLMDPINFLTLTFQLIHLVHAPKTFSNTGEEFQLYFCFFHIKTKMIITLNILWSISYGLQMCLGFNFQLPVVNISARDLPALRVHSFLQSDSTHNQLKYTPSSLDRFSPLSVSYLF